MDNLPARILGTIAILACFTFAIATGLIFYNSWAWDTLHIIFTASGGVVGLLFLAIMAYEAG